MSRRKRKYYLAGPITGVENLNRDTFNLAEAALTSQGYTILNPHNVARFPEKPAGFFKTAGDRARAEHAYYMRETQKMQCKADAVILLPGWTKSKGALHEFNNALMLGQEVFLFIASSFTGDPYLARVE